MVPATEDERRWFCLKVAEGHRKDFAYFSQIRADMDVGGRANLLYYLLNLDVGEFEIRDVPETDELRRQQAHSRRGVEALVEEWCHDATLPFSHETQPNVIKTAANMTMVLITGSKPNRRWI